MVSMVIEIRSIDFDVDKSKLKSLLVLYSLDKHNVFVKGILDIIDNKKDSYDLLSYIFEEIIYRHLEELTNISRDIMDILYMIGYAMREYKGELEYAVIQNEGEEIDREYYTLSFKNIDKKMSISLNHSYYNLNEDFYIWDKDKGFISGD